MKKFLMLIALGALITVGCSEKKSAEDDGKVPVEVKQAEAADTTSMDSAQAEADTTETPADTSDGK